jgi:hypothetical protein
LGESRLPAEFSPAVLFSKAAAVQQTGVFPNGEAMASNTNPLIFGLHIEGGLWKVSYVPQSPHPDVPGNTPPSNSQAASMWIGTAVGPKALSREEVVDVVRSIFLSRSSSPGSMTVAEFVERKFVPIYLAGRSPSTRINYRSILKHIVEPNLVDRAFGNAGSEGKRIRFNPGWPYLGSLVLKDVNGVSVQNLIDTAIKSGYSMHTVSQIRNAVCMIFSFATTENDFGGENPARCLEWPGLRRRSIVSDINGGAMRNNITSTSGLQCIE